MCWRSRQADNNGVDEIRDLRESVKYPPTVRQVQGLYHRRGPHAVGLGFQRAAEDAGGAAGPRGVHSGDHRAPAAARRRSCPGASASTSAAFPAEQIVGRLREAGGRCAGGTATDQALHVIARAAEGGMRDALSILDMCLGYQSEVTGGAGAQRAGHGRIVRFCSASLGSVAGQRRAGRAMANDPTS